MSPSLLNPVGLSTLGRPCLSKLGALTRCGDPNPCPACASGRYPSSVTLSIADGGTFLTGPHRFGQLPYGYPAPGPYAQWTYVYPTGTPITGTYSIPLTYLSPRHDSALYYLLLPGTGGSMYFTGTPGACPLATASPELYTSAGWPGSGMPDNFGGFVAVTYYCSLLGGGAKARMVQWDNGVITGIASQTAGGCADTYTIAGNNVEVGINELPCEGLYSAFATGGSATITPVF